jgi:hypothetical protein
MVSGFVAFLCWSGLWFGGCFDLAEVGEGKICGF